MLHAFIRYKGQILRIIRYTKPSIKRLHVIRGTQYTTIHWCEISVLAELLYLTCWPIPGYPGGGNSGGGGRGGQGGNQMMGGYNQGGAGGAPNQSAGGQYQQNSNNMNPTPNSNVPFNAAGWLVTCKAFPVWSNLSLYWIEYNLNNACHFVE